MQGFIRWSLADWLWHCSPGSGSVALAPMPVLADTRQQSQPQPQPAATTTATQQAHELVEPTHAHARSPSRTLAHGSLILDHKDGHNHCQPIATLATLSPLESLLKRAGKLDIDPHTRTHWRELGRPLPTSSFPFKSTSTIESTSASTFRYSLASVR